MSALSIKIEQDGDKATMSLIGRLDTNTAPEFEVATDQIIEDGAKDVVVDMSQCGYVSSAGLRVIIALQKKMLNLGSLLFRGVVPEVKDVFDMTGFSTILSFEE